MTKQKVYIEEQQKWLTSYAQLNLKPIYSETAEIFEMENFSVILFSKIWLTPTKQEVEIVQQLKLLMRYAPSI